MKKALTLFAFAVLVASHSFAAYVVVLKDGTRYVAKKKYTIVNGKAHIERENGQVMAVDPALIDVAKSEQLTKLGITSANIVDLNTNQPPVAPQTKQSLGASIKLRQPGAAKPAAPEVSVAPPPVASGAMPQRALENFERAYDNVGIFEKKVISTGGRSIRAELTADTEERVFNAISATSYLIVKNAGIEGVQIDMVELFMRTTTGGSAGRFQMTREQAEALNARTISHQDYFVRNVIY